MPFTGASFHAVQALAFYAIKIVAYGTRFYWAEGLFHLK
jgi:hypothetical protein